MSIEEFAFAIVSIAVGLCILGFLRGLPVKLGIVGLVVGVMYFGPLVYGKDWYYDGFTAGIVLGTFAAWAFSSPEAKT
jgi:hypothetical protein